MAPHHPYHHLVILLVLAVAATGIATAAASSNPFTPKSAFIRYYARKVQRGNRPLSSFLLSKLSPLSAASLSSLLSSPSPSPSPSLSLPSFCTSASLLCPSPHPNSLSDSTDFAVYTDSNFTNYGTSRSRGADSFRAYSEGRNLPVDSFRRYSRSSSSRPDSFQSYSPGANVVSARFSSYASSAVSGSGKFSSYARNANIPTLAFSNYDTDSVSRPRDFLSYSDDSNSGDQSFSSYSKHGDDSPNAFHSYAGSANHFGSSFEAYGEDGNSVNDNFTSYGTDTNHPVNTFKQYGENGNGGAERFASYDDEANVGDSSFQSYAKHANAAKAGFESYGKSYNPGTDRFKGYGEDSTGHEIGFKTYHNENTTFKSYAKSGITFATYRNSTTVPASRIDHRWVEPGKFFRESVLTPGSTLAMADIRDKSPKRSFLPRSVASKLPFSAAELTRIFEIPIDSALGKAMENTVAECERAPSHGETKRCATSAEDMVDFAVSVLGDNVVPRSTEGVDGWGKEVAIGNVRGIDGTNVTKSVSCHQSLFPYLVYYCHSVPKVRVYEAEILDATSKQRINTGVALCHLDTSDWSATHGAFIALGSKPGEIEVCHWIFEGDMAWTVAD